MMDKTIKSSTDDEYALYGAVITYSDSMKSKIEVVRNNPNHWMNNLPSYSIGSRLDTHPIYTVLTVLKSEKDLDLVYITPKSHPEYFCDHVENDNYRLAVVYRYMVRPTWVGDLVFKTSETMMDSLIMSIMNDIITNE